MSVLADAGPLYALLDRDDPRHGDCVKLFERERGAVVVPLLVVPEVCYLAQKYLGADVELRFLEGLFAGQAALEFGGPADLERALAIMRGRPDLGVVDASVIAIAERLKVSRVATFDRRHFAAFRPAHCPSFEIVP